MSKLIRPRVEVAFHMRRPQHDLLVMQREHNFHEDGRIGHPASGIVKKGENISLVITSHQNPSVRNRAGCTKQNGPHQEEEAKELQGRYRPLRVPSSEGPRLALGVILCWNHLTRDFSGLGTSEHQPPTHAWSACLPAPASDAPVHGSVGANGDASQNLWLKSLPKRMARPRTSFGGLPEVVQAFFQLQKGWRKGFVNGHAEVAH